jgi:uncharacterized protein
MRRRATLAVLGTAALPLAGCVEALFFHPDDRPYTSPQRLGVSARDVTFPAEDGSVLHGWWLAAQGAARATVVHAHGNAANISNHLPQVAWLPAAGVNVLMFDYRGFGRSEGRASLHGVVADTRAAIAAARREAPGTRLVLLGQSLGGASSIRAAATEQAAGAHDLVLLVSDSAFASYRGIARDAARGLLMPLGALASLSLPGEADDPLAAIARVNMPVLLLHGERDRVIPFEHGERLHAAANEPKTFVRIADGGHLDALPRADVRARIRAAIDAAVDSAVMRGS